MEASIVRSPVLDSSGDALIQGTAFLSEKHMKPPVSFVLQPSFGDQTTNYSYQQQTPSSASRVQAMAIDQQPILCSSIAWNSAQQVFNKHMTQLLEKKQATNIEIKLT